MCPLGVRVCLELIGFMPSLPPLLLDVARRVSDAGGQALLVGGAVRDQLRGQAPRDWDLEVHRLEAKALHALLALEGTVVVVGRSFGLFKLRRGEVELDVALPRPDSLAGDDPTVGAVAGDPHMGLKEAARRRDLTINAIALDPLTGDLLDPHGGIPDLEAGRLRAVDPDRFGDDPLRALRVAAFSARLVTSPDVQLIEICRGLDLSAVAPERLCLELDKLLSADAPGRGIACLDTLGIAGQVLPEWPADLGPLATQMDQLVAARALAGPGPRPRALAWALLLSPLDPEGATAALNRLGVHTDRGYPLRARCLHAHAVAAELMLPQGAPRLRHMAEDGEVALGCALAWALAPTPVAKAAAQANLERARALGVDHAPLPPLLLGRALLALGHPPGPDLGALLNRVRTAQLDGQISTPDQARALVQSWGPP
jgi:tRNA nucleotidyltransferase (CCA-adding enzyme)